MARASASLGELQQFLECGFDAFQDMKGANEFLALLRRREISLALTLFQADLSNGGETFARLIEELG